MSAEEIFYKHVEGVGTKKSIINAMEEHASQNKEALRIAIRQIKHFREQLAMVKVQKSHWKDYYTKSKYMQTIREIIPFDQL